MMPSKAKIESFNYMVKICRYIRQIFHYKNPSKGDDTVHSRCEVRCAGFKVDDFPLNPKVSLVQREVAQHTANSVSLPHVKGWIAAMHSLRKGSLV